MGDEPGGGLGGFLKEVTIVVVGAVIASTLIRLLLLQVFSIPSRSMESTLNVADRVAVQKVQPFQRGDVVVFRDDLEWLGNPDRPFMARGLAGRPGLRRPRAGRVGQPPGQARHRRRR